MHRRPFRKLADVGHPVFVGYPRLDMRIRVRFFQKSTRVDTITSFLQHHLRNYLALNGKGGGSWEQQSLLILKIARLYTKPPVWPRLISLEEWVLLAVYISTAD